MAFKKNNFDYKTMLKKLDANCKEFGIRLRPNASHGFWLSTLLPVAFLVNTLSHDKPHFAYKLSTIVSIGLLLQSIEIFVKLGYQRISKTLNFSTKLIPGGVCAFLVWTCLNQHIVFSLLSGYFPTFLFNALFLLVVKTLPKSFTLGEATLVVQGYVIFLYNSYVQVPFYYSNPPTTDFSMLVAISQLGFLGINIILAVIYFFTFLRKTSTFYCVLITIVLSVMVFPVTREPPVVVLFKFVVANLKRLCFTLYLLGLVVLTGTICWWQVSNNRATSTNIRKTFHVLIILVYIPGIIYECTYLYVGSVVAFSLFILLEGCRLIKLYPIYYQLQLSVQAFIDEKDSGKVALTPLYLLAGCSLPLWLHPCSCDLADSSIFNFLPLISGVLSVGIGDTAASFIGSNYGKHKWKSNIVKTVEGTIANIVAQTMAIILFYKLGLIDLTCKNTLISLIAVTVCSIVEAKTDQIDNLVLPLISFIILSF